MEHERGEEMGRRGCAKAEKKEERTVYGSAQYKSTSEVEDQGRQAVRREKLADVARAKNGWVRKSGSKQGLMVGEQVSSALQTVTADCRTLV